MYEVFFYTKSNGETPVLDYIQSLAAGGGKDNRVKHNKIAQYIKVLEEKGTRAGEPFVKHIDGNIWELRPLQNRILFAAIVGNQFLLLHCFLKRSKKTPDKEIAQAKSELNDYLERMGENGEE